MVIILYWFIIINCWISFGSLINEPNPISSYETDGNNIRNKAEEIFDIQMVPICTVGMRGLGILDTLLCQVDRYVDKFNFVPLISNNSLASWNSSNYSSNVKSISKLFYEINQESLSDDQVSISLLVKTNCKMSCQLYQANIILLQSQSFEHRKVKECRKIQRVIGNISLTFICPLLPSQHTYFVLYLSSLPITDNLSSNVEVISAVACSLAGLIPIWMIYRQLFCFQYVSASASINRTDSMMMLCLFLISFLPASCYLLKMGANSTLIALYINYILISTTFSFIWMSRRLENSFPKRFHRSSAKSRTFAFCLLTIFVFPGILAFAMTNNLDESQTEFQKLLFIDPVCFYIILSLIVFMNTFWLQITSRKTNDSSLKPLSKFTICCYSKCSEIIWNLTSRFCSQIYSQHLQDDPFDLKDQTQSQKESHIWLFGFVFSVLLVFTQHSTYRYLALCLPTYNLMESNILCSLFIPLSSLVVVFLITCCILCLSFLYQWRKFSSVMDMSECNTSRATTLVSPGRIIGGGGIPSNRIVTQELPMYSAFYDKNLSENQGFDSTYITVMSRDINHKGFLSPNSPSFLRYDDLSEISSDSIDSGEFCSIQQTIVTPTKDF